ncbi:M48 family metallopeptidase [Patescibacteria group bacterium]|nr:M48 family metallopeptidase [Patescibacteria group bacterium]
MTKQIKIHSRDINYTLKTSKKAKKLRLAVYCDGSFVVTKPMGLNDRVVEKYIMEKSNWVLAKIDHFKKFGVDINKNDKQKYLTYKNKTLEFVQERIQHFNSTYQFKYNKINIKNQKTRWGSCSKKRNLNFNYKILFLPKHAADYIIVHELCHLKEFNHSTKFWNLVATLVPNHKEIRKEIRNKGLYF